MIPATRIMIDLETLGTVPGSVILSIGAVRFDDEGILDTFYHRIDPEDCARHGLLIDPATVLWWFKQEEIARLEVTKQGLALRWTLHELSQWIKLHDPQDEPEIWGNGSEFDNVMLAAAYRAIDLEIPWKYNKNRCYRTLKNLFPNVPKPPEENTLKHHALADATWQARHLIQILKHIPSA